MEITFISKEIRDICQISEKADSLLGKSVARVFRRRITDILAADNYSELPLGNPRIKFVDEKEYLILDMKEEYYLCFDIGHSKPPKNSNGLIDWKRVYRIKLVYIGKEK
ncbi:hypothetical protein [Xenorhabdus vietnamensis]|uniref:hypothetical protein n=1 Tax=Xenorhabdus vietnamensis TaxID=351656 RepID=UPI000A325DFF|nr:hypothetical protein [Xenorhabdus vietnamensis]